MPKKGQKWPLEPVWYHQLTILHKAVHKTLKKHVDAVLEATLLSIAANQDLKQLKAKTTKAYLSFVQGQFESLDQIKDQIQKLETELKNLPTDNQSKELHDLLASLVSQYAQIVQSYTQSQNQYNNDQSDESSAEADYDRLKDKYASLSDKNSPEAKAILAQMKKDQAKIAADQKDEANQSAKMNDLSAQLNGLIGSLSKVIDGLSSGSLKTSLIKLKDAMEKGLNINGIANEIDDEINNDEKARQQLEQQINALQAQGAALSAQALSTSQDIQGLINKLQKEYGDVFNKLNKDQKFQLLQAISLSKARLENEVDKRRQKVLQKEL